MRRCLFLDDSSVIRKVAKRILSGENMTVVEAETGSEGLSVCAADMPDIIVVDGTLPDMDTVSFIRHVRAMPAEVTPQILVCVVELDVGAIMRAKRAGAQGFLLKPFNRSQLLSSFHALPAAAAA